MINNAKCSRGRNGFTLVELLAVIVILAIILVIAVPKVMSVIEDSTKASFESSSKMVASQVENQYTVAQTLGKEFGDTGSCMQDWAGLNESDYESCTYEITSDGSAKVTLTGKGKFKGLSVCNATRSDATATEDVECGPKTLSKIATTSTELGVTSVDACATSGICEPGTSFAIKVSDTEIYKFYVINDDDSKVTLIMSENFGEPVEWISQDDYDIANADDNTECDGICIDEGPITALNELKERTKDWDNIDPFSYTLKGEKMSCDGSINLSGYEEMMITNVKARIITELEIASLSTGESCNYSVPDYLYASDIYWTSSSSSYPYIVQGGNTDYLVNSDFSPLGTEQGLRPVIEIKK